MNEVTFPTKWMYGKPRGFIKEIATGYMTVLSLPDIKKRLTKYFLFRNHNNSFELAYDEAQKFLQNESDKRNLTRNQIRYLDEKTIEVKLTQNQTMKINSYFLDLIQKYILESCQKKGIFENKYYVKYYDEDGNHKPFTNLICSYNLVRFANGDSLDLRLENLEDRSKNKLNNTIIVQNENKFDKLNLYFEQTLQNIYWHYRSDIEDDDYFKYQEILNYYNSFKKIVEEKGGKMKSLPLDYINALHKLKVICQDLHEFQISLNNLQKGKWCPDCNINMGEIISKCAIEHLLDKPFIKTRSLAWLKTKENTSLELDIYNEELKIAIEYDGLQHSKFIKHFHKTEENFIKRQEYDKLKDTLCKENNVLLIRISHNIKPNEICNFIATKLKENERQINDNKINSFDMKTVYKCITKLEKIKKKIEVKGGKLIEGIYYSSDADVTIQCEKEHIWTTKFKYIQNGAWCHTCGFEMDPETRAKISKTLKEKNETEEGKLLKKESHIKRSETMRKLKEELRAIITEKKCNHCKEIKSKNEFGIKNNAKDGLQTNCRKCVGILKKEYKQKKLKV